MKMRFVQAKNKPIPVGDGLRICVAGMFLSVMFCLTTSTAAAAPQTIKPGEIWPDDRGRHVQAHGGGIIRFGDAWYWFGEDRTAGLPRTNRYVSCYSSPDLAHWTFHNDVVKFSDPANLGRGWVLERPKVFYNARTKKFVMYMHFDNRGYKFAGVGVATCDTRGRRLSICEQFPSAGA